MQINYSESDNPILLEWFFNYKVNDIVVRGAIDRVDLVDCKKFKTQSGLISKKLVKVIDYKTGKYRSSKKRDYNMQLALYSIALEQLTDYKIDTVGLLFLEEQNVNSKKDMIDGFVEINVSESARQQVKEKVIDTVDNIAKGNFDPKPNQFNCKYCDYASICPNALA